MSWALHRKFIYVGSIALFIIVLSIFPIYKFLNKTPTCFDGKKNGDESGVDIGGGCAVLNPRDMNKLIVNWSRTFKVSHGLYEAVASVENSNLKAGARSVIYKFKLYNKDNVLIAEKFGKTFVGPNEQFMIFESGIHTGERIPKYVFFEFAQDVKWVRVDLNQSQKLNLSIKNQELTGNVDLYNNSTNAINDIDVSAVIYDINDNAIAVSSTHIDTIGGDSGKSTVFTWQDALVGQAVRIDIIPRVNPFKSDDK